MHKNQWNHVSERLELWGCWLSESENAGFMSKSPLVKIMEYGVRTEGHINNLPPYEIDKENQETHRILLSTRNIDVRLYELAYLENAWHHIEDTGEIRRKLKLSKILKSMDIKKRTYQNLKQNLYYFLIGNIS